MMQEPAGKIPTLSIANFKSQLAYLPWHTLIFIVYMMLYGFQRLQGNIILPEFLGIMAISVGMAIVAFLILQRLVGIYKASLIVFIVTAAFFLFGHIYHIFIYVYSNLVGYLPLVFSVLIIALAGFISISQWTFAEFNKSLNILAVILGVLACFQFGQYLQGLQALQERNAPYNEFLLEIDTLDNVALDLLPDVYYLLFDAYPSNAYLLEHFGIDNSDFTDELEDRGFYVAYDATSNYTGTKASLSSTLNMDFVQTFAPPSRDVSYDVLDPYIANSRVARMMQELGYHYVQFGNGLTDTVPSVADTIIDITPEGDLIEDFDAKNFGKGSFWHYMYTTTWLRILDPSLSQTPEGSGIANLFANERFHTSVDVLQTIPAMDEPTFTYFHSIKPHLPVTLDANGELFRWENVYDNFSDYLANEQVHVADQIAYVNQTILETLDIIFAESEIPPVIVIQADHGMVLTRYDERGGLLRPIPILNAFYFPDGDYSNLYGAISSINTFPVIFNQYYGTDYPLFDDESRYYVPDIGDNGVTGRPLYFNEIPEGRLEPPYE